MFSKQCMNKINKQCMNKINKRTMSTNSTSSDAVTDTFITAFVIGLPILSFNALDPEVIIEN